MADTAKKAEDASSEKHEPKVVLEEAKLQEEDTSSGKHEPKVVLEEAELQKKDASIGKHEPNVVLEEANLQKEVASPTSHEHERVSSPEDPPRKARKSSENSPLHPHYQAEPGGKMNGGGSLSSPSPSWERKVSSETARGAAPLTPGRSRTRSTNHGNETPDEGPSVPKFGEWDESDPASADGYTQIFNIVKEERQGGAGSTPSSRADKRSTKEFNQFGNGGSKCCSCFPW